MESSPSDKNLDSVLNEVSTQELQSALKQLVEKKLPAQAQAYLRAELYIEYGQYTKAFKQLEDLLLAESRVECMPERKEAVELNIQKVRSEFEAKEAKGQVERRLEGKEATELNLQEEELDSEFAKERLPNLLTELKALSSYDPCGKNGCSSDQRAVWSRSTGMWVCVGC